MVWLAWATDARSERLNGFEIVDPLVPANEIMRGGPPRDGIPSIDYPRFVPLNQAGYMSDGDRVLGIDYAGIRRAYPIRILNYHEIVNDDFAGRAVLVSFCPLCGTGMAFSGILDEKGKGKKKTAQFGVSGLLYNSDLLMYDRATESLWSQIEGRAISGPMKGARLELIPVQHTTWADWKQRYPDSQVLSLDTGHQRNYGQTPYPGYQESKYVYFPVTVMDRRYHPKELVLGVELNGKSKVYPFMELYKGPAVFDDVVGGQAIRVEFDGDHRAAQVFDSHGKELPSLIAFWFAWMAFHPDSEVYQNR
ncbi:hypothetical protein BTA51_01635 [Hahella sp. CCB-MM4]|uniref:DUF3179 domain-containing protein n=1 Tax=Hahella sp. (strain CCB-MM4) TaxID=1926491 RepID=UPI000B9BC450|nr:DUF3179 domain-containing protein [Hahella sp. CCB-MM4]OZG75505.1 hypothetical protein BTA51_01635 [Hahella sp. CCB-MM4]